MIDKSRLEQKCSTWNITLTGTQLDQLDAFAQILVEYNQKVNLTAITDQEGIEDKHFLDSLLFASQPEVAGKMVDVGAGAGFPGIVTKIYKPELELTLMEPTGKRVEFLKYACGQLGLTGVEFAKERAEEAARKAWREQFDLASARAVAALPMLAEYCLPLVKVGGNFLAMKGASGEEELAAALGNHRFAATYTDIVTTIKVSFVLARKTSVVFRCMTGWRFGNVPSACCFRNCVCSRS